jgi:TetR/AcrR family tetracycline transcriptional repressor
MAPRPNLQLDRDRLIAAAFAQLEEDGLDGLSMRRLAARLDVQAPALYWHVGDKAELLGLMARDIYAPAYSGVPAASDWRGWLLGFGRVLRRAFARHRDGARLCAIAPASGERDIADHAQQIAAPLVALGLDQARALSYEASVISFALGWASFEANGPMHDYLDEMLSFDESFETGLKALVSGFPDD